MGYAGYVLEVNLTTGQAIRNLLPDSYMQQHLSGKMLAAQLLWDCTTGAETAFSEENPVVIAGALLTGTGAPGSNRFDVASLSPKDGLPTFSNCGGDIGVYLKKAGYDGLILKGKAENPQWLEISGQDVVFYDARGLWNMGTGECREALSEKLQKKNFSSLCIGPAGEYLVKFASLMVDGHSTGRDGLGAVLGWKNLKAITVSGRQELPVWNAGGAAEINRNWHAALHKLAGNPMAEGYCRSCPLHCARHGREEELLPNELGMDAIGADAARKWAAEQGFPTENLYEDIAFRRGIGDRLAEGIDGKNEKGGKRRGGSHGQIAAFFDLPPEEESTKEFCRNFVEAVSVCGQCVFTANALQPGMEGLPLLKLLENVTGQVWTLPELLALGQRSRKLESQLKERYQK